MPATKFRHATRNLQGKPTRELGRVLDALDETIQRGAWSFQEVVTTASDFSGAESFTILDGVGRKRHTIVLSSPAPGSIALAIAANSRWAKCIHHVTRACAWFSVLLQASTKMSEVTTIPLVSCGGSERVRQPRRDEEEARVHRR